MGDYVARNFKAWKILRILSKKKVKETCNIFRRRLNLLQAAATLKRTKLSNISVERGRIYEILNV